MEQTMSQLVNTGWDNITVPVVIEPLFTSREMKNPGYNEAVVREVQSTHKKDKREGWYKCNVVNTLVGAAPPAPVVKRRLKLACEGAGW